LKKERRKRVNKSLGQTDRRCPEEWNVQKRGGRRGTEATKKKVVGYKAPSRKSKAGKKESLNRGDMQKEPVVIDNLRGKEEGLRSR